jgi:hypothetical protein
VSVMELSSSHGVVSRVFRASEVWLRFRRRRVTRELAGVGSIGPLMAGSRTWSRPANAVDTRVWTA